jgi:GntR family transcriptional regulator, phosphonate transport system regulatory protein
MTQRAFPQTDHEALTSGVSLWRRIADELEQSIARGTFKPGSKLPGEVDIAQRFGVNRHTVRRAIAALAQRGLVRAERGSGTFIERRRIPYPIRQRTRFSETVGGMGHTVSGRLIAHTVEGADAEIARILKLTPGAPALRLDLLRHADRVPVCVATTWLDAQRFPGAARVYTSSSSVTRMLMHFGVRTYVRKSTRVTAAIAEAADAALLRITLGRPMLVVDSVDVDGDGAPVLTTHARFAADRLELVIET